MTDPYDVSLTEITIPEPPPRFFRLQVRIDLRAADATNRIVANGSRLASLSASGLGFVPTHSLAKGATLQLEFDVVGPDATVRVEAIAEVVRVIDDDFELYVGCRFVDFDGRARDALLGVLESLRAVRDAEGAP